MTFSRRDPKYIERMGPTQINEVKKANEVRRAHGLALLKIKVRTCLACGYLFESAAARTCGCTRAKNVLDIE